MFLGTLHLYANLIFVVYDSDGFVSWLHFVYFLKENYKIMRFLLTALWSGFFFPLEIFV